MKSLGLTFLLLALFTFSYAQVNRSVPPQAGKAPVVEIGESQQFTLANGLKVVVVENNKLPRIIFNLSLNIDPISEGNAAGFTAATGDLLRTATKTRTKSQIDEAIDFLGASLFTYSEGVYGIVLSKHKETFMELLADVVLNPVFTQEELDKYKNETISGIKTSKSNPNSIATNVATVLRYPNHPYGEILTEETVNNITLEHCKNYYQTYFKPNVAYLTIVGDITAAEAKLLVEKYFGQWQQAEVPKQSYTFPQIGNGVRVAFVDRPAAVQSVVSVFYPAELTQNSEFALSASVANTIFGGGVFSSYLMTNLREDKAYTYGAYSSLSPDQNVATFSVSTQVRNEVTDSAIVQILEEMKRICTEIPDKEHLEQILSVMNGNFALSLEDPQTVARFALNTVRYNLPENYYATYLERLSKISQEDVLKAAKKYFTPNNCIILVVGNKAEVAEKLAKLATSGKVEFYDEYGNPAVDKIRPAPENVNATQVIDNYINAIGGKEKLNKVEFVTYRTVTEMPGRTLEVLTQLINGKALRKTTFLGTTVMQQIIFDGEKGQQTDRGIVSKLTVNQIAEFKAKTFIFPEKEYIALGYKLNLLGIENINSVDCYKIEITTNLNNTFWEYYSVETGLKVRKVTVEKMQENMVTTNLDIISYTDIQGVKYVDKFVTTLGGQPFEFKTTEIDFTTKPDKDLFKVQE